MGTKMKPAITNSILFFFLTICVVIGCDAPVPPDEGCGDTGTITLIAPANNTTWNYSSIRFSWEAVEPAPSAYRITIFHAEDLSIVIDSATVTDTSFRSILMDQSQRYQWRVEALDDEGVASFTSDNWTVATLAFSELISPADGDAIDLTNGINFEWAENPFATYELTVTTDLGDTVVAELKTDKSSIFIDTSDANVWNAAVYFWRINPVDSGGVAQTFYGTSGNFTAAGITRQNVLFAIDCSLSMTVSDPSNQRITAVAQFLSQYNTDTYPEMKFSVMLWAGNVLDQTRNGYGNPGFTRNQEELDRVLASTGEGSYTDYLGATENIGHMIENDILMISNQRFSAQILQASQYIVVFLSDGIPYPEGGAVQLDMDIWNEVEDMVTVLDDHNVGRFNFHTLFLSSLFRYEDAQGLAQTIAGHEDEFETISRVLLGMARRGNGVYNEIIDPNMLDFQNLIDLRFRTVNIQNRANH